MIQRLSKNGLVWRLMNGLYRWVWFNIIRSDAITFNVISDDEYRGLKTMTQHRRIHFNYKRDSLKIRNYVFLKTLQKMMTNKIQTSKKRAREKK